MWTIITFHLILIFCLVLKCFDYLIIRNSIIMRLVVTSFKEEYLDWIHTYRSASGSMALTVSNNLANNSPWYVSSDLSSDFITSTLNCFSALCAKSFFRNNSACSIKCIFNLFLNKLFNVVRPLMFIKLSIEIEPLRYTFDESLFTSRSTSFIASSQSLHWSLSNKP